MLLALPPELLVRIVEFSMPDGFESLALSCRTMYEVAKPIIATHNRLRSKWGHVTVNSFNDIISTVDFLHAVARWPVTAEYVKSADLRGRFPRAEISQHDFTLLRAADSREQFKSLIAGSRLLAPSVADWMAWADKIEVLTDEYGDGEDESDNLPLIYQQADWATAFLLALLTNVRVLSVGSDWQHIYPNETGVTEPWGLLEKIARLSHDRRVVSPQSPLSRLTELRALSGVGFDTNFKLQFLFPLLALSSLERLYASGCTVATYPSVYHPIQWPYPDLTSNLRTIEFLQCCIDEKSLSNLLDRTPNLVSFKYSHQTWNVPYFHRILSDWDAGAFVATIGKYCGHQLTTLAITIHRVPGSIITGVVSMKEFTRLETAELDVRVFAGPSPESGERFGEQYTRPSQSYQSWTPAQVPKLTEILPPSLKRLWLFNGNHESTHEEISCALLKDFAAGRDWLLSDLEDVIFCHRIEEDPESSVSRERRQKIMDKAKAAGIEFRAGMAMFPRWHREFARKCSILGDGGEEAARDESGLPFYRMNE